MTSWLSGITCKDIRRPERLLLSIPKNFFMVALWSWVLIHTRMMKKKKLSHGFLNLSLHTPYIHFMHPISGLHHPNQDCLLPMDVWKWSKAQYNRSRPFPCAAQYKSSQCNKLYLSDMYLSDLAYIVMLHLNRGPSWPTFQINSFWWSIYVDIANCQNL